MKHEIVKGTYRFRLITSDYNGNPIKNIMFPNCMNALKSFYESVENKDNNDVSLDKVFFDDDGEYQPDKDIQIKYKRGF